MIWITRYRIGNDHVHQTMCCHGSVPAVSNSILCGLPANRATNLQALKHIPKENLQVARPPYFVWFTCGRMSFRWFGAGGLNRQPPRTSIDPNMSCSRCRLDKFENRLSGTRLPACTLQDAQSFGRAFHLSSLSRVDL